MSDLGPWNIFVQPALRPFLEFRFKQPSTKNEDARKEQAMTRIRTISELIAELQEWPADSLVHVAFALDVGDSGSPTAIVGVSGYAGGAIDGRDSGVTIDIDSAPTRYRGRQS